MKRLFAGFMMLFILFFGCKPSSSSEAGDSTGKEQLAVSLQTKVDC